MSKPRNIEMATDADLRGSWPALQRAAARACALAEQTDTAVVVLRDGLLEHVYPRSKAETTAGFFCLNGSPHPGTVAIPTEPWVSVTQVAQHLGVAKDTVYRRRKHQGLPAHRVGRLWKFKLSEVDDWVRAGSADDESNERSGKPT
jgi:excisionase family DNA binding protein